MVDGETESGFFWRRLAGVPSAAKHTPWHGIGHRGDAAAQLSDLAMLRRIGCDKNMNGIHERLRPGAVLTTTDLPFTPDTRSGKDFVVVTTAIG